MQMKDPAILLSLLNTKLRDYYSSLEELCEDMDENPEDIKESLQRIGYVYSREKNQFIKI